MANAILNFHFLFFAPLPKPNLLMLRSVKLSFLDTLYLQWTRLFARKIWITYKLAHMTYHQNSSNQPDDPMGSTEPPGTPKDPPSTPFGPLNIPLDPIGPLISPELPYK